MLSAELSENFLEMADILEIVGDNPFKIRAYRKASEVIGGMADELLENYSRKELDGIPGIGIAIAEKTIEYRETGKINELEKLREGLPSGLLQLLDIPGLGPKTLRILWYEFGVEGIADLKQLLQTDALEKRPQFGPKKVANLRHGVELFALSTERIPYQVARERANKLLAFLRACPEVLQAEAAGSLRRKKETIGDIDLLVSSKAPQQVTEYFLRFPEISEVIGSGSTKTSVLLKGNLQVDVRILPPESFGAALQYFTGSKEHNILLRKIAIKKGLHLSEYGVFDGKDKIAGETEEGVYEVLGQKWMAPEKRLGKEELN